MTYYKEEMLLFNSSTMDCLEELLNDIITVNKEAIKPNY